MKFEACRCMHVADVMGGCVAVRREAHCGSGMGARCRRCQCILQPAGQCEQLPVERQGCREGAAVSLAIVVVPKHCTEYGFVRTHIIA